MKNLILLTVLLLSFDAAAISKKCTPQDLKVRDAGYDIFAEKSTLDWAAASAGLFAITPDFVRSSDQNGKREGEPVLGGIALLYAITFGSWVPFCDDDEGVEPAKPDIATVREIYDGARRTFWISYALSAVSNIKYISESDYSERKAAASVALVAPFIISILGEWDLIHAPTDAEITPLLVTDNDIATGFSLAYRF
jgi:hypothetical protein